MLALIVRQAMTLVLLGIVAGLAAALASTSLLRHLLFGVSVVDPLTFVLTSVILLLVALAASYLPARRAAKVDPLIRAARLSTQSFIAGGRPLALLRAAG